MHIKGNGCGHQKYSRANDGSNVNHSRVEKSESTFHKRVILLAQEIGIYNICCDKHRILCGYVQDVDLIDLIKFNMLILLLIIIINNTA